MEGKSKRSEEREEGFRLIFSLGFEDGAGDEERVLTATGFTKEILEKTSENLEKIDEHIKNNLNKWKFERINKVDLALIRVAICEILFLETPKPVAISEVLKLAKDYNGSETFINGILAKI
ncbi:MAG: transcription antitermination factor NusB [Defluviitaleaceae bacterium]|nr:transcription antitermination factor NusB [Defluviitaleaceae bacterium]